MSLPTARWSLGRATWSDAQLDAVAARAREWLGEGKTAGVAANREVPVAVATSEWDSPAFVTTSIPIGIRSTRAIVLRDAGAERAMQRHQDDLLAEARQILAKRPSQRVVALVLDQGLPAAEHYRAARQHLRGTCGAGPEITVVVSLKEAFRILSDWPHIFDQFETFNTESIVREELSTLLMRPSGAAWRRASF